MAARSKLTVESLTQFGAGRLAEILIDEAARNRRLKQALQMVLAAKTGSLELSHQVRKRLTTLARSDAFVSSKKARELSAELEQLKAATVETIGAKDPKLAVGLLWQFLELHASIFDHLDDSNGRLGTLFRAACQDLGPLLGQAKMQSSELAAMTLNWITNNGYYDGLVFALSDALGPEGRSALRVMLAERLREHLSTERQHAIQPGHFDYTRSGLSLALRDLADCENDTDAFIETYQGADLTNPAYATEIAQRLLRANRAEEALSYLDRGAPTDKNRHFKEVEWSDARIAVLDMLGRKDEAQALRLAVFERHLSAPHLKAYLERLADFERAEAESVALDRVERYGNVHAALNFLINWPALVRVAHLVESRIGEIDGDRRELLDPAASALQDGFPLASVLLRRRLIDVILQKARSARYRDAVRYVREIESQQSEVTDFGRHESHAEYMACLKREHARKSGFWKLFP